MEDSPINPIQTALDALKAPRCGYIPDLSRIILRLRALDKIDQYWPDLPDHSDSWSELNHEEVERARNLSFLPAVIARDTAVDFAGLPKLLPSVLLLKASTLDWHLPGEDEEFERFQALVWSLGAAMYPFGYNRLAKLLECHEDDINAAASNGLVELRRFVPDHGDIGALFGARVRRAVAELVATHGHSLQGPFPGERRLQATHIPDLLREIMWLEVQVPEASLALGTYLGAIGELDDAKVLLDAATTGLADSPFARYMYIDCCQALGAPLDHDMFPFLPFGGQLEDALVDESAFTSGVGSRVRWQLVFSGLRLQASVASPLLTQASERTNTNDDAQSWMNSDDRVVIQLRRILASELAPVQSHILRVETHLQTATTQQNAFLLGQVAALLPARRRQTVQTSLKHKIGAWDRLPVASRDQLVTARYLDDDPALTSPEAVSAIVMAVASATEAAGREWLELGNRAGLDDCLHWYEEHNAGWARLDSLVRLRDLRVRAAHLRADLTRADADEAWGLVIGTAKSPGLLQTPFEVD